MPEEEQKQRKIHPIVRNNYIPRIIASSFYLLIIFSIKQYDILEWHIVWLIPAGLVWPHVAFFSAYKAKNAKRQELINMHLDCVFSGLLLAVVPAQIVFTTVFVILIVNALFIGAFRLLASTLAVLAITYILADYFFQQPLIENTGTVTELVVTLCFTIYFSCFALMGFALTRKMIKLNKQIKSLSVSDPLTDCFNRLYLDKNLTLELRRCYRLKLPLTLIFADLDHFKKINDNYGHVAGDFILKRFVAITQECIRSDVDWIARFGGEEFIVVLPRSTSDDGVEVAERIRERLSSEVFEFNGQVLDVTCSFGVSSTDLENRALEAECLLAQADNRLYKAKAKGRDRVEFTTKNDSTTSA